MFGFVQQGVEDPHDAAKVGQDARFRVAVVRAHERIAKVPSMPLERLVVHIEAQIVQVEHREHRRRPRNAVDVLPLLVE